ncbi:MAG TPA: TolC family protein [Prolixibacteraceae bacterium]
MFKINSIFFLFASLCASLSFPLSAQEPAVNKDSVKISLNLKNIVDLAISQSSSLKSAQNQHVSYYWRYRNFSKQFLPNLILNGTLPNYTQSTVPVTQPDGSIEFKQVSNLTMNSNLYLNQYIPLTGTQIYASTSFSRVQDYNKNSTLFSGSPFSIGFYQPIFAYNWMKWTKKAEPMIYDESQKNFIQTIEAIAYTATSYFFNYLRIQTNYNLAKSSFDNSSDNLKIAQVKKKLGQISENDFSRIELSVLNAQKSMNSAKMELKNADFTLKSYIGLDQKVNIELQMPLLITLFDIDPKKALKEARENRSEQVYYQRRLISAESQLTQAKRSSGLTAALSGNYGLSNSAETFQGIYSQPLNQRMLQLSFSIPILDWGKAASSVKMAESNRDLVSFDVKQSFEDFDRGVIVQVEQFSLLKDQLKTAEEADKVAANGYIIALKKFKNGEITITDMNIASSERVTGKLDYINSLATYWLAFYRLRMLTLFDFELDQKIFYDNPMLAGEIKIKETLIHKK